MEMNEIVDNILTTIGNMFLIGLLFYVVFWLHRSGFWFLILLFVHFETDKHIRENKSCKVDAEYGVPLCKQHLKLNRGRLWKK